MLQTGEAGSVLPLIVRQLRRAFYLLKDASVVLQLGDLPLPLLLIDHTGQLTGLNAAQRLHLRGLQLHCVGGLSSLLLDATLLLI